MIIIVESGATKTAWRSVSQDGTVREALTSGLNPTYLDHEHIKEIIREAVPELNPEGVCVEKIFFYGAGLVSEQAASPIRECLELWCPMSDIEFNSDIMAAARALFGDSRGIVAIMGTGSNSCLYEDGRITDNIRPGGFILGDEGSAAALGKAFLADYIKGLLPVDIENDFRSVYGLEYACIIQRVYKEPAASAFLASLAPYILSKSEDSYVNSLICSSLEAFVTRSLLRYTSCNKLKVGVVGSYGSACKEFLLELGDRYNMEFVAFIKSPIDELIKYHTRF